MAWGVPQVFSVGDETGKGGHQRPDAANIDADKQRGIIACELRKQDDRGHIADALAGEHARQKQSAWGRSFLI